MFAPLEEALLWRSAATSPATSPTCLVDGNMRIVHSRRLRGGDYP